MNGNRVMVSTIVKIVSNLTGVSIEDIKSSSRNKYLCELRSVIVSIAREYSDELQYENCNSLMRRRYSFPQIAKAIGRTDHTTVINSLNAFAVYSKHNPNIMKLREKAFNICASLPPEINLDDQELKQKEKMLSEFKKRKKKIIGSRINKDPALTKEQREEMKKELKQKEYSQTISDLNSSLKNKVMPNRFEEADEGHLQLISIAEGSKRLLKAILSQGRTHAIAA